MKPHTGNQPMQNQAILFVMYCQIQFLFKNIYFIKLYVILVFLYLVAHIHHHKTENVANNKK